MKTEDSLLAIHVSQRVNTTSPEAIVTITDLYYQSTQKYQF